jgi:6-phosphogluconolactonase
VSDQDDASNARLLRETLLKNHAAAARFTPLVDISRDPAEVIDTLNRTGQPALPDVAVLGMGDDGHTASIFADAPEWDFITTTTQHFVQVHPVSAPHTRISWSLDAIKRIDTLFLQIGGETKRKVLDAAAALPERKAISRLALAEGVLLDVYWFA